MLPEGRGGFCGLRKLVAGAETCYVHFVSSKTAHGERNGVGFSAEHSWVSKGLEITAFRSPWAVFDDFKCV
mgnify:CR=1 FL=1